MRRTTPRAGRKELSEKDGNIYLVEENTEKFKGKNKNRMANKLPILQG